jgi:signal transduction histidine kinase
VPLAAVRSVLHGLSLMSGIPVADFDALPVSGAVLDDQIKSLHIGSPMLAGDEDGRYLLCRYHRQHSRVVIAGPYRYETDPPAIHPVLSRAMERSLSAAMHEVAAGLGRIIEIDRSRLELESQLEMIGNAVIAIASELELETVLRRIVDLARDLAGAQYAALGVPDQSGDMIAFITTGLTGEQEAMLEHPPRGLGVLGLLISSPRTLRLENLADHPASVGFPQHHPPMKSFLGVPIVAHGRVFGSLYLTEKRFGSEFTDEDARLVEILARHAAVAIENAELFERAEAQQLRLQLIIDQLPEAIVLVEASPERVTLANRQASVLLGWDIEEATPLVDFVRRNPRRHADGTIMRFDEVPMVRSLRNGEVIHQREIEITRPYDPPITLLVNSAPLRDERDTITGTIVVFQDITKISDAEQLKDDFLSLVSHELRTPLTTIQGGAHILHENRDDLDDVTRQALITDIHYESRRLGTLVENMVQLANIRAGRFAMETEPVPVHMLATRAVAAVSESAPDREFQIAVDRELMVEGDFARLDQVVRNLLYNAVKYAPDETRIDVSATCLDNLATISVRDYGPGIDPEDLPHVFERFQRGASAVAGQRAGMGLGLYLCKHLVEAHGGQIWIERPHDGKGGAEACFTIPAVIDDI